MSSTSYAGIQSIAEYLPAQVSSVGELHDRGLVRGSPATLRSFGFSTVHLADHETNIDMAVAAADRLLRENDIDRDEKRKKFLYTRVLLLSTPPSVARSA